MDLYAELLNVAPGLAERTVFLTGGATEGASAAFVAKHSERVILKPPTPGLIVAQLKALFED